MGVGLLDLVVFLFVYYVLIGVVVCVCLLCVG